jgi:hypothetical protein
MEVDAFARRYKGKGKKGTGKKGTGKKGYVGLTDVTEFEDVAYFKGRGKSKGRKGVQS